jgi:AraC-like DNA-binding protein
VIKNLEEEHFPENGSRALNQCFLFAVLAYHHLGRGNEICHRPVAQDDVIKELGVSQPTVSRLFKDLFGWIPRQTGSNGMTAYRRFCDRGEILLALRQVGRRLPAVARLYEDVFQEIDALRARTIHQAED